MEQTAIETKTYQIGGRTFRAEPVVARQEKWLWPVIKPLFQRGEDLTAEDIFSLMGQSITFIVAVLLIPDGKTQPEKVKEGLAGVQQLEEWLDSTVSVSEMGPVIADFFTSGQQWNILRGLAGPLHRAMTTGLTTPSAPSLVETSSKPNGSGTTPGLETLGAISNDVGNGALLSGRS